MSSPTWLEQWRKLEKGATEGPWRVGHDGPSRPILLTKNSLLSLSKLEMTRHSSYEEEDADHRLVAFLRNTAAEVAAKDKAADELIQKEATATPEFKFELRKRYEDAKAALDRRVKELQGGE